MNNEKIKIKVNLISCLLAHISCHRRFFPNLENNIQSNSSIFISFITSWEFPTIVVVIFRPIKHQKKFAFLTDTHPVVTALPKNNLYPFLPLIKKQLCKLTNSYYRQK